MSQTPSLVDVLLVGDDSLALAGLASLLADQMECRVVGQVSPATEVEEALDVYQPEAVILDLGWSAQDGAAASDSDDLEPLHAYLGALVPVVVLISNRGAVPAVISAGALGVLSRESDGAQVSAAVLAAVRGLTSIDPSYLSAVPILSEGSDGLLLEDLTPRESEVLRLLADGLPNKTIAYQLQISEHTVKFHVNAIFRKLGVQSRTEAVVRATRLGMIPL